MIDFLHPLVLLLLPLAAVPLLVGLPRTASRPSLGAAPVDLGSRLLDAGLRVLGVIALAALLLALAGARTREASREIIGKGANLVLLIDRSASMDQNFAGRNPQGDEESKSGAARRLLIDFIDRRDNDRIGVAAFSTAPMLFLPMTDHKDALKAAVSSIVEPGLGKTDVGRGLVMAFGMFEDESEEASRAVVLVSDGAGVIGPDVQRMLQAEAVRRGASLYWLFIRTKGARGLSEPSPRGEADTAQTRPERHLHLFLGRLGIPYRAFEAENPEAVAAAMDEINKLESRPLIHAERIPGRDLSPPLFGIAALCAWLLLIARLVEHDPPVPNRPVLRLPGMT